METLFAEEIGKSYKGRQVVRGVNLKISRGEVVGLLGPNGAGKTTSFYMIVGLVPPETGRILVDDVDITHTPMYLRARNFGISYLPQEPSVFRKLTVEENIIAVLEAQPLDARERRTRSERLIHQLNLSHIRGTRGYALSGGERALQRNRSDRSSGSAEDHLRSEIGWYRHPDHGSQCTRDAYCN
jgi:lipopolysaccharide export system ATP-binding protein